MVSANLNPAEVYSERVRTLSTEIDGARSTHRRFLQMLLLAIGIACYLGYEGFIARSISIWPPFVLLPIIAFLGFRAERWKRRILYFCDVRDYYELGIARLEQNWDKLDGGLEFAESKHDYAKDLDLFGRGSMFQLLSSARTRGGKETLARWMKVAANAGEVKARREAISELASRTDLRESIAGIHAKAWPDVQPTTFRDWVMEPSREFRSWMRIPAILLAMAVVAIVALYAAREVSLDQFRNAVALVVVMELGYAAIFRSRVSAIEQSMGPPFIELPLLREMVEILSREKFSSQKLLEIQSRIGRGEISARTRLRRLHLLMWLFKQRDAPWLIMFAYPLLWGTQFATAIELWRERWGTPLLDWLVLLGEFEALVSLSAYRFEHPQDTFPELLEDGPELDARAMRHPLLNEQTCVANDVRFDSDTRFLIVSGSNMSGKSTFLRAIGVTSVLAWMGAPVRCAKLRISRVSIVCAIQVQDSIVDGRSGFFTEMQRLKRMIDIASEGPTLFLADEMMSGTNSHDRRIAAEWVVKALVSHNAIGAISTHDLALAEIAKNGSLGKNVCFEDVGDSGELRFDYKLKDGLPTRSNALNIARMLGIHEEET